MEQPSSIGEQIKPRLNEVAEALTLVGELDRFMKITGINQKLFNNLAAAYLGG